MDQNAEDTIKIYETIIQEVITRLKKNSDKGQLQMSESDIQVFRDLWMEFLKKIRDGSLQPNDAQIQQQQQLIRQPSHMEDEPAIVKKVKINNHEEEPEIKQEDGEDDEECDLVLEEDFKEQSVKQEQNFDNENPEEKVKREEFRQRLNEGQRDRTLFDKIRDLAANSNQVKNEEQSADDDDSDEPKNFDGHIFAQKINNETVVSRIRPNKQQKASLENVLIKEKPRRDLFYAYATLQFNFKTNKKKSNQ